MFLRERSPIIMRSAHGSHKKGFTMIELLMTIVVVGIVSIPLSLLVSQHFTSVARSSAYAITLNLARLEMEKVNNLAYAGISDLTTNYPEYNYDVVRTMSFEEGDENSDESLKRVRIEVQDADNSAVLYSVETFIAKNIGYGP